MRLRAYFAVCCTALAIACSDDDAAVDDGGADAAADATVDETDASAVDAASETDAAVPSDASLADGDGTDGTSQPEDGGADAGRCPANACTDGAGVYCGEDGTIVTCTGDEEGCLIEEADVVACADGQACQGTPGEVACACAPIDSIEQGRGCAQLNSRECSLGNSAVLKCVLVGACMVWDDGTLKPEGAEAEPGDNCEDSGLSCQNKQCVCPSNVSSDFYVNGSPLVTAKRNRRQLVQNGLQHPAICSFESVTTGLQNALVQRGFGQSNRTRVILDNCDDPLPLGTGTCSPVLFDQNGTSQVGENGPLHVPAKVEVLTVEHPEVGGNGSFHPGDFIVVMSSFSLPNPDGLTAAWTLSDTGRIAGFTIMEGGCDVDGDTQNDEYCSGRYNDWPNVMVQLLDYDGFRFQPGVVSEAGRNEPRVEHMHLSGAGGPLVDPSAAGTEAGVFHVGESGMVTFTPDDDEIVGIVVDLLEGGSAADSVFLMFHDASGAAGNYGSFGPVTTVDEDGYPTTNAGDAVAFAFYNPNGVDAAYSGGFLVNRVGDIDVGLVVGRDELNNCDYGGPSNSLFGDTNASIFDIAVSHFASSGANGGRGWPNLDEGPPRDILHVNRGRIGVLVDDDFAGNPTNVAQPLDRVKFNGGLLWGNDTGMAITDGHVILNPSLGEGSVVGVGNPPFEIDGSTGQGLEIFDPIQTKFGYVTATDNGGGSGSSHVFADPNRHENTSVIANEIIVHGTRWAQFFDSPVSPDYLGMGVIEGDDLNGNGINVTGDGTRTTFFDLDGDGLEDLSDCFEPADVDCSDAAAGVFTMNGGLSLGNDGDGLAILTMQPFDADRQLVTATGASFLNNGAYGVDIGNCVDKDGGNCHGTRLYDAELMLDMCVQQDNGVGGLLVEENAPDATTTILGGF